MQKDIKDIVFWAPSVTWTVTTENFLKIQNFLFKDFGAVLFPQFYFETCRGILKADLIEKFPDYDTEKISSFIQQLEERKILINEIQEPDELFFPQNKVFQPYNCYKKEMRINENELGKFVNDSLMRETRFVNLKTIELKRKEPSNFFVNRRTTRCFDIKKQIKFADISELLSVMRQKNIDGERKYYYSSAGGLYPIDCYLYVKGERVQGIDEGIYYYAPCEGALKLINESPAITKDAHYFLNQNIFEVSAFSIFFVYNAMASMPKYGSVAYYYAIIDLGIMVEALSIQAELIGLGSCSIGDMDFRKIRSQFKLERNEKYLHCMEFGQKNRDK